MSVNNKLVDVSWFPTEVTENIDATHCFCTENYIFNFDFLNGCSETTASVWCHMLVFKKAVLLFCRNAHAHRNLRAEETGSQCNSWKRQRYPYPTCQLVCGPYHWPTVKLVLSGTYFYKWKWKHSKFRRHFPWPLRFIWPTFVLFLFLKFTHAYSLKSEFPWCGATQLTHICCIHKEMIFLWAEKERYS